MVEVLKEAVERLEGADGELVVDFSSLPRIDSSGLRALEELARKSEEKSVKVALRGVSVDVYRVLKLMKLTGRFTFVN